MSPCFVVGVPAPQPAAASPTNARHSSRPQSTAAIGLRPRRGLAAAPHFSDRSLLGRRFCFAAPVQRSQRARQAAIVASADGPADGAAAGDQAAGKAAGGPPGTALQAALTAALLACSAALDGRLAALGAGAALPAALAGHPLTAAVGASLAGTAALGYGAVPLLRRLKAGQYVREDGPQAHLKKGGTPTMGGLFLLPAPLLVAAAASGGQPHVLAACLVTLAFGAVGFADDFLILLRRTNTGISPRAKLLAQIAFGAAYALWLATGGAWLGDAAGGAAAVGLPGGLRLPLGPLYPPFAVFTLAAMSNGVNITDGVDGLAAGTVAVAAVGLAAVLAAAAAGPLAGAGPACEALAGLALFAGAVAGGCLGFLHHNRHPAAAFMGDTGSLALGAALAAPALAAPAFGPACLLAASLVFLAETLSVVAQVAFFKWTRRREGAGRRLLRMAPLHHHLELGGWPETRVVAAWYAAGAAAALLALALLPTLPAALGPCLALARAAAARLA